MERSEHVSEGHPSRPSGPATGPALSVAAAICGAAAFAVGIAQVRIGLVLAAAAIVSGVAALRRKASGAVLAKIGISLGVLAMLVVVGVIAVFVYKFSQLGLV